MKKLVKGLLAAALLSTAPALLHAQTYVLDKKIPLTGDGGYDYVSIDKVNNKLYVSHGTMVNVVDLATEKQVATIEGQKGNHGIAIDNKANKGFISDGRGNSVMVFDLTTYKTLATIPLDSKGADAIVYDPASDKVFTFNGDSNNSCVVDPNTLKQVGTVALGGAPEFAQPDGKGKMYNNLEDKSSLVVFDTKTLKVIRTTSLSPCGGPTGLALDLKNNRAFTVCRENKGMSVVDMNSGKVVATVPIGAGVDAVAYDAETKLVFCSNGDATTTIIKQKSADEYSVVQTLATQTRAKTMALDPKTHKIYLSVVDRDKDNKVVPGSFQVLVYKMQ